MGGKAAVERAFNTIQQLLFEKLPGYTGIDVADRGPDPEGDACMTVEQMERLIASWIVGVWQKRVLQDCPPFWDPDGAYSPNMLVAMAFRQTGLALEVPLQELFYELLPAHDRTIDKRRGIKFRGLWYDDRDVLADYRNSPSSRGGQFKKKWIIRSDPRDRRNIYFQDPFTHAWHALPWTGMPEEGNVPAFADARVEELLKVVKDSGMRARTDTDLLPVLLDLIDEVAPVSEWPINTTRAQRVARVREITQAAAAAADRTGRRGGTGPAAPEDGEAVAAGGVVTPLHRPRRPRTANDAVTAEKRRRGDGPPPGPLKIPGRMGASFWQDNPFVPPASDDDEEYL